MHIGGGHEDVEVEEWQVVMLEVQLEVLAELHFRGGAAACNTREARNPARHGTGAGGLGEAAALAVTKAVVKALFIACCWWLQRLFAAALLWRR